jgi:hypothetical protein
LFYIIYHIKDNKIPISNSLILFWDINCKKFIINYLNNNNISYKIIDYQQDVSTTLQVGRNYFCLMNKHPQQFSNISILLNSIYHLIDTLGTSSIIGISTAGSIIFNIGDVVQFNSATIFNYKEYSLDYNFIEAKNILYKTSKFVLQPITDTKGFINIHNNSIGEGQDEFITYIVSNHLNIPCLTLTGISDNDNKNEYDDGGGHLASQNTILFLYQTFNLL